MPNDSAPRIGFIGSGVIAWAHGIALSGLMKDGLVEAELGLVHDRDPNRSRGFAEHLGFEEAASAEEVAAGCDVVYVCTSTAGHLEAARVAARHRRAVFCEKPLGRSLAEAAALVEVVGEAGVPAQVGLVLRTAPVFRALGRLVESGELGRPMAATMRDDQFFPIQGHYGSTWRKERDEAGSGTLLEHAIHDLDAARNWFGPIRSVAATSANFAGHEEIEDAATGILTFEGGLSVAMVSVWHSVLSRPSTRRVEVIFEHGFASFENDFTGPITIQTSAATTTERCDPPAFVERLSLPEGLGIGALPYVEENKDFLDTLAAGQPPSPSLVDGLRAHEAVDAWYRSAAAGGVPVAGPF